ncbi:Autotransporter beta-domain protein [Pseudovibrio sp. Ad13]|uniref:Ig-like domain-containing protein n=1 Tax=Pseudovibrio sp. Ad13 TaxID=989396 RepID=UPI0007B2D619|nr:choice-of-anchor D domain-containing protein [Pseudovibrio sp. Ad13]KZK84502.1 Autotransporter beta-domain protein [Pseudovibrio sp. Ad13]
MPHVKCIIPKTGLSILLFFGALLILLACFADPVRAGPITCPKMAEGERVYARLADETCGSSFDFSAPVSVENHFNNSDMFRIFGFPNRPSNGTGVTSLTVTPNASISISDIPDGKEITCASGCTVEVSGTYDSGDAFSFKVVNAGGGNTDLEIEDFVVGAATSPEADVSVQGGSAVADGGADDVGSVAAATQHTRIYTVTNSGTADLTLGTISDSSPTNVTVDSHSFGSTTVLSGNFTTLTVNYTPTFAGDFDFTLSFVNNDDDESPYNFTASGTATGAPELDVNIQGGPAVASGGTDDVGTKAASAQNSRIYTVKNNGTDDLTLGTISESNLTNVSVDSTSFGSTTITPSNSTTLTVIYTPTLAGDFSFDLSFVNDDGNENPYSIALEGTATGAAEIALEDSDSNAIADGGSESVGTQSAASQHTVSFTVLAQGTDTLTLGSLSSDNESNVSVDSTSFGSTSLTPGDNTTLTINYSPTLTGSFSFDISFVNNDSDENPFNITVSGTASGVPEIDVAVQGGSAVADGGTDSVSSATALVQSTRTYTITNNGTDDLTLGTISDDSASNVSVDSHSFGSTTVSAGNSTTLTVNYTPTLAGTFSFDISFVNDDGNENPYDFTVSGNASGTPEIAVSVQGGSAVADGGTDSVGTSTAGAQTSRVYTVQNAGTGDLTLGTISDDSASNVSVDSHNFASTTVTPGNSTTLSVTYTPTLDGAFSFDISFVNDDGDENPFDLTVSGTGSGAPEIAVSIQGGSAVVDGGTDSVGTSTAGAQTSRVYTVQNTGTDDLTLGTISDDSASNVSVDTHSFGNTTVTPGNSTTLTVTYTPTLAGAFSFDISFVNDDGDENPFDLTISGTGSGSPEIAASSSESGIISSGGTDTIPATKTVGVASSITYTITNSGTGTLTLTTPVTGINVTSTSEATVDSFLLASDSVAASGGTTTLTVNYTPTSARAFGFTFFLASNDSDESSFTVVVSGTAGSKTIVVTSGDSQSTTVTTGFSNALEVTVEDANGAALAGETITYTAPSSGASLDTTSQFATTNGSGVATLSVISNTVSGSFIVSASVDGAADPAEFNLVNLAGAATGFSVVSGTPQSVHTGQDYEDRLVVRLVDTNGNGVQGVSIDFAAPTSGASVTFQSSGTNTETITTDSNGKATSSALTANNVASPQLSSNAFETYAVTASTSGFSVLSFSLSNTRSSEEDIQRTKTVIAAFVANRIDSIVAEQPSIVARLKNGSYGQQRDLNSFFYDVSENNISGSFQFSYMAFQSRMNKMGVPAADAITSRIDDSYNALFADSSKPLSHNFKQPFRSMEEGLGTGDEARWAEDGGEFAQSGFDFWVQGVYAKVNNQDFESENALIFAGVDYRFQNSALLGVMAQLDISDQDNNTAKTSASGVGWMFGPYGVAQLHNNVFVDARITYGRSSNDVNALGLFTDGFDTQRFLLQGAVTGDFQVGLITLNPFARLTYFYEKQESYTDSLANVIPSQDFNLGRLEFGPQASLDYQSETGLIFAPFLSFSGIYDFDKLKNDIPTDAVLSSSTEDIRARIEAGADIFIPYGNISIRGEGFYDGIGVSDFEAYGGKLNILVPF